MNFHALTREKKDSLKPVVTALRNALYGNPSQADALKEGLVINFGKRAEARHTVKIQILENVDLV